MQLVTLSTVVARRVAGLVLGAFVLAIVFPQGGFAQTDPFVGKWTLNLAKSTYKPGPVPRSVVFTVETAGQGVQAAGDAVDAAGMATHLVFTILYDGKIHPVTGSPNIDGNSIIKTDAYTMEYTNTKAGALIGTGTFTFSTDGRSLTIASRGRNAAGQRVDNLAFYDKQ